MESKEEYTVNYTFSIAETGVVTTGGQKHFASAFGTAAFILEFTPAPGLVVRGTVWRDGKQTYAFERWGAVG